MSTLVSRSMALCLALPTALALTAPLSAAEPKTVAESARTAPEPSTIADPKTRRAQIDQARHQKKLRLFPERESTLVQFLNSTLERGAKAEVGRGGPNGFQPLLLGGMRSGQGLTLGVGYRRSDLFRERFGYRLTGRFTFQKAYLADLRLFFPRLREDRAFVDFYAKYENSPQMDYYGPGSGSSVDDRSSFRLEDLAIDTRAGWRPHRRFRVGAHVGYHFVNVGRGQREGVPSTDEIFDDATTPGIDEQTDFARLGVFAEYDSRDFPGSPRSGSRLFAQFLFNTDIDLEMHDHWRLDAAVEHYIPWRNKTSVLALRLGTHLTFHDDDQVVPFYLQPTLGGNEFLRGFARYRFYDDAAIIGTVEHRWHLSSHLSAALFVEAGQVAHKPEEFDLEDLSWSGGFGLRFEIVNSVVMRVDQAWSEEGYRMMWTFSNVF